MALDDHFGLRKTQLKRLSEYRGRRAKQMFKNVRRSRLVTMPVNIEFGCCTQVNWSKDVSVCNVECNIDSATSSLQHLQSAASRVCSISSLQRRNRTRCLLCVRRPTYREPMLRYVRCCRLSRCGLRTMQFRTVQTLILSIDEALHRSLRCAARVCILSRAKSSLQVIKMKLAARCVSLPLPLFLFLPPSLALSPPHLSTSGRRLLSPNAKASVLETTNTIALPTHTAARKSGRRRLAYHGRCSVALQL